MSEKKVRNLLEEKRSFFVPFYQRGYRWTDEEIEQLLEDILNWEPNNGGYFLQLLVVCWNEDEKRFNIVDGQQRLTTISLILYNLVGTLFDIKYARGEGGEADARFQKNAQDVIIRWMTKVDFNKDLLKNNILNATFLYHEVLPAEEEAMFQQLNTWRIPATDAELVKCIVLSKGTPEVLSRRAYEWDMVERSLQNNSFWGMLGIKENDQPSRMEAFLHNCYKSPYSKLSDKTLNLSQKFPLFEEVNKDVGGSWWDEVFKEWQNDCAIYGDVLRFNYIGWINNRRLNGGDFRKAPEQLSPDLYTEAPDFVRDYLLLANAAYSWLNGERYDFYRHRACNAISIEHIHARNQRMLNVEDLMRILHESKKNVPAAEISKIIDNYVKNYEDDPSVVKAEDDLASEFLKLEIQYPDDSVDHSIGNLALLTKSQNSSFNNGTFRDKTNNMKDSVINGDFFPVLTQAVFFRTLPGLTNNNYWSIHDRKRYCEFMGHAISGFLDAVQRDEVLNKDYKNIVVVLQ